MIVLCSKTCGGKDTTLKELIKMGYKPLVSYTTRPPRVNEVDGVTYNFISKEEFLQKQEDGFFAESTSYKVATGETWYYGAAIEDLTNDKVAIMNVEGIKAIKHLEGIETVVFFLDVPDKIIKERLIIRGDNPKEAKRRLRADKRDFRWWKLRGVYDYKIVNDNRYTPKEVAEIIDAIYKGGHVWM